MSADTPPTREEWRRLYATAARIKEMAPWEWMEESAVFGVQTPAGSGPAFVSVMGMLGEHLAISVYPNPRALYDLWDLVGSPEFEENAEQILEIPQLMASFEDREMVEKEDRQVMNDLGLKFRGRQAWPVFRSYRPGFVPWFLAGEEARLLARALEQLADVAPRFQDDESLLQPPGEYAFLVRRPRDEDETGWEDRIETLPPPEPEPLEISIASQIFEAARRLPTGTNRLEVDFFITPTPMGERGERPAYPYFLLAVDQASGMVVHHAILHVEESLPAMLASVPQEAVQALVTLGARPREIRVRSERLRWLLGPIMAELEINLRLGRNLRRLDQAKQSLFSFLSR